MTQSQTTKTSGAPPRIYDVRYVVREYRSTFVSARSEAEAIAKAQAAHDIGALFEVDGG